MVLLTGNWWQTMGFYGACFGHSYIRRSWSLRGWSLLTRCHRAVGHPVKVVILQHRAQTHWQFQPQMLRQGLVPPSEGETVKDGMGRRAHCPSVVRVIATTCGSKTMGQWMSTIKSIVIYATDLFPIQLLQEHLLPGPPSHIRASTFAADAVLIARPSKEFRARLLGCQASFKPHQWASDPRKQANTGCVGNCHLLLDIKFRESWFAH